MAKLLMWKTGNCGNGDWEKPSMYEVVHQHAIHSMQQIMRIFSFFSIAFWLCHAIRIAT